MSIILGIDPGTTTIGFCILEKIKNDRNIIEFGVIETIPKDKLELKIFDMMNDLEEIVDRYKPEIVGIEKLFFTNNQKTGMDVAHARGAMIYLFAKKGISIKEYTPLQVKHGICGNGTATKKQVQNALKFIFKLNSIPRPDDAADAMAIAYITSLNKSVAF